jgi:hypothetical protein
VRTRVYTPRRVFLTMREFAEHLRCTDYRVLYIYLEPCRDGWRLKPLDEAALKRWRRRAWRRKETA